VVIKELMKHCTTEEVRKRALMAHALRCTPAAVLRAKDQDCLTRRLVLPKDAVSPRAEAVVVGKRASATLRDCRVCKTAVGKAAPAGEVWIEVVLVGVEMLGRLYLAALDLAALYLAAQTWQTC